MTKNKFSKICSVEGCEKPIVNKRGWCSKHYARWIRHGDLKTAHTPGPKKSQKHPCKMVDCTNDQYARGWCKMHYDRWRSHGNPAITLNNHTPNGRVLKWLKKLVAHPPQECVVWPFAMSPEGYGKVVLEGNLITAHRASLILATGEDHPKIFACHGPCHNRLCVNPKHLYWGTAQRNVLDRVRDGTDNRGERHGMAKLTADDVAAIRKDRSKHKTIAKNYRISQSHVSDIKSRKSWSWLQE
jgi:hypothetical protein